MKIGNHLYGFKLKLSELQNVLPQSIYPNPYNENIGVENGSNNTLMFPML